MADGVGGGTKFYRNKGSLPRIVSALTGSQTFLWLKRSLTRLKGKELDIIQKRYYQDMTQTEIAGELGISQAQVSRLEKNAIAVLKKEFDS